MLLYCCNWNFHCCQQDNSQVILDLSWWFWPARCDSSSAAWSPWVEVESQWSTLQSWTSVFPLSVWWLMLSISPLEAWLRGQQSSLVSYNRCWAVFRYFSSSVWMLPAGPETCSSQLAPPPSHFRWWCEAAEEKDCLRVCLYGEECGWLGPCRGPTMSGRCLTSGRISFSRLFLERHPQSGGSPVSEHSGPVSVSPERQFHTGGFGGCVCLLEAVQAVWWLWLLWLFVVLPECLTDLAHPDPGWSFQSSLCSSDGSLELAPVLLRFTRSPYLQDSCFSVLSICWGPHAHFWEGHTQTSLYLWISSVAPLKMADSVAALQTSLCTASVHVWTFLTATGSAWSLLVWTGLGCNAGMLRIILI